MNIEEKIDLYLSGQMSAVDAKLFESEIADDDTLRKEVDLQQLAMKALVVKGELKVKKMLQNHESKKGSLLTMKRLLTIAIILMIGLVCLFFFRKPQQRPSEIIMAQYFTPYKSPTVLRGTVHETDAWKRGAKAYAEQNYQLAAQEFASIKSDAVAPLYLVKFYRANALLAANSNESATAITLLSELIEGQHDYVQQSKWYLVQAYLKSGQRDVAKDLLKDIIKQKHYKHRDAEVLLDEFSVR